jgi:hypothetical protein
MTQIREHSACVCFCHPAVFAGKTGSISNLFTDFIGNH